MRTYKVLGGLYLDKLNQELEKAVNNGWQLLGPVIPNATGALYATLYREVTKH